MLSSIKDYFKYTIKRPELLNRIGDNFIVFDFIREKAVEEILNLKLSAITENLEHEKGIKLEISPLFKEYLLNTAQGDLSNGGRGISNIVETCLVNPLAKVLVKEEWTSGDSVVIEDRPSGNEELFKYSLKRTCGI